MPPTAEAGAGPAPTVNGAGSPALARREVWKYPLSQVEQTVAIPDGARAVHAAMQNDSPTLWFELDPTSAPVDRKFVVVGTGWPLPAEGEHRGSLLDGMFVWHIYEVPA